MTTRWTTQRDTTPYRRVTLSSKVQGDDSGPRQPSKPQGEWLCDEPYKYFLKSSKNPLELCNEVVEKHDENVCRQLKEEINFLMVVAGLFLAVVAAFTVESYKFLQEDKQDTMSDLLIEVVRLLNDTSARGKATLPKPFTPNHHAIVVNQLWFLSMILSLIAVAMGTFCLQWISAFSRGSDLTEKSVPPHQSLALRQLRYEGVVGWGILRAPEALLLLVQLSIGLFTCGLIYSLWNISRRTTIPALVAACLAGALLYLMNLLPFLQSVVGAFIPATLTVPQCPYKSPTSWLIQSAGNLLPYILKLFLNSSHSDWVGAVGRPGRWLKSLPLPFTDFLWKQHDLISAKSRETWQDSWTCAYSRLHYFGLGLSSALDRLIYEPDAKDIISSCLQDLQPIFQSAEDWEMFSRKNLSDDEKSFLDNEYRLVSRLLPPRLNSTPLQLEHANRIRVDFLNALILQHLTRRNAKLARILFHHRMELYIRVKNSTEFIVRGDESGIDFGRSLHCPLEDHSDIGELDLDETVFIRSSWYTKLKTIYVELKFQFLSCAKHLFDIRRFTDLDIMSAAAIVRIEGAATPTLSENIGSEIPHTDPPVEELHEVQPRDQQSVESSRINDLGNKVDPGTTPSPPDDPEGDRSESVAHDTNAEDTQLRASLTSLCSQVQQQLFQLRPSDFEDINYYRELHMLFGIPVEFILPEPKNPCNGIEEV